ncbi:MAG: SRPBCC family protein [Thermoanaerobaculia bacterium]
MILERTTVVDAPAATVWAFFSDPANLAKITPPSMGFQIVSSPGRTLQAGDRIDYRIRIGGLPVRWRTLISGWDPPRSFTDEQEKGPYRRWIHHHTFQPMGDGKVLVTDHVDYELPFGILGRLAGGFWVRRQLRKVFDYRSEIIRRQFGAEEDLG